MRNLLSRLLVVALLLVACSGAVWGDGLKVTITKKGGGTETKEGQASLQEAFNRLALKEVVGIKVSAGNFTEADWKWLKANRNSLTGLKKFEVTDAVGSVADIPDTNGDDQYFGAALEELHVAKLKRVGNTAIYNCTGLTSVSLPAATEIGDEAFGFCSGLTSVLLSAATKIGVAAFEDCAGLKSVQLPAATMIGDWAFLECKRLTSVSLPVATKIGDAAFEQCISLTSVKLPVATEIGDGAFLECKSLTSVSLPVVTAIIGGAFRWCDTLTSLQLGATPPSVSSVAFDACPPVRKLELTDAHGTLLTGVALTDARSNYRKVEDGDTKDNLWYGWAFEDAPTSRLSGTIDGVEFSGAASLKAAMQGKVLKNIKKLTITEGKFQVSDWGFLLEQGQHGLAIEKFTIASSADTAADMPGLRYDGPRYLPKAQQVNIANVKKIGDWAFADCTGLTSVSLPAATKIGDWAFNKCTGLTSVSLPAATEIVGRAFRSCSGLTRLQLGSTPPTYVRSEAFTGCPLARKLELVDAHGTPLAGDALTGARSNYRKVEDGDTEDNLWYGWAFEDAPASNLSGTIDGVEFSGAASLEAAMQGKDFSKVKEVTITDGSFHVTDWAFLREKGQHGLAIEKFTIDSSVKVADLPDLRYEDPRYLPKAQQVNIAAKVKKIGDRAFSGCTGLTSLSLPAAAEIGENAFFGCSRLTSVSLPAATKIGDAAFGYCDALKRVSLPAATKIGRFAFTVCPGLTSVLLPVATKIGDVAFQDCTRLTRLQLGATPPSVGTEAFAHCPNSRTLIITDATGRPLVGTALATAAANYDGKEGAPNDGKWYGWTIQDVSKMGSVEIHPSDGGTVTITRKAGGAVVNEGETLTKDEILVIDAKPKDDYKLKTVTATGADKAGKNEWKVTAKTGEVIFTVVFEKLATLGATVITPAGSGTVSITRKASGDMVNKGDALTKDEVLIVKGEPDGTHKVKKITAAGATNTSGNEWKVTANPGEQVVFTVEFEKAQDEENKNNDPTPVESVLLAQVQLSPNPTDGQVTINAGTTLARCEVYSSMGALLQAIESPESVFTIDLTASPSGVYLVRLVDMQGGCKTLRVVKQ